ncbi:MAG: alpha/beta hydrolase [Planctomycetota bacterium]
MRTILYCTLAVLVATSLLPSQRRRRRDRSPAELQNFTFEQDRYDSKAVGKRMLYGVYLPKEYDADKDKTYPLVIWLHGMWEDHMRFHQRGGAEVLDQAVTSGKLPPCIFITANGGRSSMYVNRDKERWEDLISEDLLTHVSKTYRVSGTREQRAIMGVSMGGMGALRIAFKQPKLFGAVAAHSSAVFAEDPEDLPPRLKKYASRLGLDAVFGNPIEKEPWQKANPLCIANRAEKEQLAKLNIYFDAGSADRYGFADGNTLLHDALDERKIEHTWRLIQGGGHSWGNNFQDKTLPYSFAFVGKMFRGETAEAQSDAGSAKRGAEPADSKGGL